ncbi:hypothetical protein [Arthrobacter crystallopoietes]|uniref:Uncharacterized protein n=1 Tax=Crystallibacter crystallopoietes TaxID=37928 RepID=A0A1H1EJL9_9MICC|nr:hypothetical protein [Arthrobacter crystallopoietes]AUI49897.1 hypothetical protein AC20117_02740 [Arthrobacter crystallopoietes]SDQ88376.1 hypothetical protein SAMN04489742_2946 [Arthrobacter crystallopoietes]
MNLTDYGQLLLAGMAVVAILTATTWAAGRGIDRPDDLDNTFWYAFAGLSCALTLVFLASALSATAASVLMALLLLTLVPAGLHLRRRWLAGSQAAGTNAAAPLAAQHDALIKRWLQYELDPAAAAAAPALSDAANPATAAMLRGMRRAELLRPERGLQGTGGFGRGSEELVAYARAVTEFGRLLAAAEREAGVTADEAAHVIARPVSEPGPAGRVLPVVRRTAGQ